MFIYTLYTLTGETLGQTPLLEQAMRTARAYAAVRRVSCVVECRRLDTDEARRAALVVLGRCIFGSVPGGILRVFRIIWRYFIVSWIGF